MQNKFFSLLLYDSHLRALPLKARSHLRCSRAERSKDHNKATAVTTKHKELKSFTEHTLKRTENNAFCCATLL